jgi:dimethylamine/trimethylamine dehydrogenase
MEQHRIERSLLEKGVSLVVKHTLSQVESSAAVFTCNVSDRTLELDAAALVMVTLRVPDNHLYFALAGEAEEQLADLPFGLQRIGDCMAPGTIAAAVYDGHRCARELDQIPDPDSVPFRRERPEIDLPGT